MNDEKPYDMKSVFWFHLLLIGLCLGNVSCRKPAAETDDPRRIRFDLSLDSRTRAPQEIDFNVYTVRLYVFEASETSTACTQVMEISSRTFTVSGLSRQTPYRFVFLAIPKGQQPELPATVGSYETAEMQYLSGNQPDQEVFRSLLTLDTSDDIDSYSIVLTRQNGAIQIRMSNADGTIRNARLEVEGLPTMLLQDATGGKVLSAGDPVLLSKSEAPSVTDNYRIGINLLPTEDLTGRGQLTLTHIDGTETVYELKSTSGTIPVYPNQITWLVLRGTGEGGSFEVVFGGDINLDDDEWDGYR